MPHSRPEPVDVTDPYQTVTTTTAMRRTGWSESAVRNQLRARRSQRVGRALVLHNGPLHPTERPRVALINCGPRALLTAFTAAEMLGLKHWEREAVHVLVPGGARVARTRGLTLRLHYLRDWSRLPPSNARALEPIAPALVRAADSLASPRAACGILAAGVQQRLLRASTLAEALRSAPTTRHHGLLLLALADIGQGSEALSEIDFVRLCRRYRLPAPVRQAVRILPGGRRRYLDAEWRLRDGRRVVAEVDGALHLIARNWWSDQLRQNELVISGDLVLRFPTIVLRCEQGVVAEQLRRALLL